MAGNESPSYEKVHEIFCTKTNLEGEQNEDQFLKKKKSHEERGIKTSKLLPHKQGVSFFIVHVPQIKRCENK